MLFNQIMASNELKIEHPGTYQFLWKSAVKIGDSGSEHNDTWLRFGDADDFYARKKTVCSIRSISEKVQTLKVPQKTAGLRSLADPQGILSVRGGNSADGLHIAQSFRSQNRVTKKYWYLH